MATSYKYAIELTYKNNTSMEVIPSECIKMIVIDYDYDQSFAPIAYVSCNIPLSLYYKMKLNATSAHIILSISKFNNDEGRDSAKTYIKKELSYFFPNNTDIDIDYEYIEMNNTEKSYKSSYIGLVDPIIINRDKMIINDLFYKTNLETIIHKYMKFNLIKEPFDNNPIFDMFIIPPLEGISKFLKYMDSRCSFYNTKYRYFNDYNNAYLLSSKGKGIDIKDGTFTTVKITAQSSDDSDYYLDGQYNNTTQRIYSMASTTYNFNQNLISDKKINQLYGVTSSGKTMKLDLDVNSAVDSKTKPKMIRIFDECLNSLKSIANSIETTSTIINITKTNIDNSIIVPYKEFQIVCTTDWASESGRYLLSSKKETYIPDNGDFISGIFMTFKKVVT